MSFNITDFIKNLRAVCRFLMCITLSFPAYSESPGLSYTYRVAGENVAIQKKCGIENEAMLQRAIKCLKLFISREKVDASMRAEMTHELYRGIGSTPATVTPEQCQEAQEHIQRYQVFCSIP